MADSSEIVFRNFRKTDLGRILGFKKESAAISFPGLDVNMDSFRSKLLKVLKTDRNSVKVAETGGEIIGYVFFEVKEASTGPIGYINHVFVSEPYREQGIGTKLMEMAEDYLRSRGVRRARLTVTRTNKPSLKLCSRMGYREKRLILEKPLN